ncbi:hypothetical protein LCGC14_1186440 [marine sediment metagenome]|uniref:Uncharacterized protein n=1 Tax=marine sediment metagenome TaxID=412755 RepID=A0A0F9LKL7_9ZZZZ
MNLRIDSEFIYYITCYQGVFMKDEVKEKLMRENLEPYSLILIHGLHTLESEIERENDQNQRRHLTEQIKEQERKVAHINNVKTYLDRILDFTEFLKDKSLTKEKIEFFSAKRESLRNQMTKEINTELNRWLIRDFTT